MPEIDIQRLQHQVETIVHAQPDVRLVYLFGSQVIGATGPLSDIDLAVLLAREASAIHVFAQLEHLFSLALDGQAVDIVILNQAPIELAYAVMAQGKIIYQRSLAERVEYEAEVMSRYGDYLPFLRAQRQDIVKGTGNERRVQRYREALGRTQRTPGASGAATRPTED
ncbi:MAG: type VII toxin-antitoxin system MntA family adenylyltransferase antitoxin [Roseiflexus sp.]